MAADTGAMQRDVACSVLRRAEQCADLDRIIADREAIRQRQSKRPTCGKHGETARAAADAIGKSRASKRTVATSMYGALLWCSERLLPLLPVRGPARVPTARCAADRLTRRRRIAGRGPGRTRRPAASERTPRQLRLGSGRRGGMTGSQVTRGHWGWGSKVTTW